MLLEQCLSGTFMLHPCLIKSLLQLVKIGVLLFFGPWVFAQYVNFFSSAKLQIGRSLTYFFISVFACDKVIILVIAEGAEFHKWIASLTQVFWANKFFPISFGLL